MTATWNTLSSFQNIKLDIDESIMYQKFDIILFNEFQ